ncbi:unnamed protein product, partial [Ectocarpus sp. 6 AP-2014]
MQHQTWRATLGNKRSMMRALLLLTCPSLALAAATARASRAPLPAAFVAHLRSTTSSLSLLRRSSSSSSRLGVAPMSSSTAGPAPSAAGGVLVESVGAAAKEEREEAAAAAAAAAATRPGSAPLVHAKQVSAQEVRRRWPDSNFDVPVDMPGAVKTFFVESPTPGLIIAGILSAVALRVLLCGETSPLGLADAAAVPVVAVGWSFQEWAIHKYLLHGLENWLGHDVHEAHHDKPFYHVCVDPPDLVAGWTLAAAFVFKLLLPLPLAITVLVVYMSMGLVYEWVHFIVHTRVVPRSQLGKDLKRHHTLHHLKDETCWLAFTAPPIDTLFGTVPSSSPEQQRQQQQQQQRRRRPSSATTGADVGAV